MASEWYLVQSDNVVGPFTSQQLRELALAGKLKRSDVVQKGDSGKPVPAEKVKNLFVDDKRKDRPKQPPPALPKSASSPDQSRLEAQATSQPTANEPMPPPLPQAENTIEPPLAPDATMPSRSRWQETLHGLFNKFKTYAGLFAVTAKSAARLTAKQAELATVHNILLPKAFAALGKQVYSSNSFQDEFAEEIRALDVLHSRVKELNSQVNSQPVEKTITEKARVLAASAKRRAEAQIHLLQISRLATTFGKTVYEKHGKDSGPSELTETIEQLLSRSTALAAEIDSLPKEHERRQPTPKHLAIGGIDRLSKEYEGRQLTPKRLAIVGIVCCTVVGIFGISILDRSSIESSVGHLTGDSSSAGNSAGNSEGNSEGNSSGNSSGNSGEIRYVDSPKITFDLSSRYDIPDLRFSSDGRFFSAGNYFGSDLYQTWDVVAERPLIDLLDLTGWDIEERRTTGIASFSPDGHYVGVSLRGFAFSDGRRVEKGQIHVYSLLDGESAREKTLVRDVSDNGRGTVKFDSHVWSPRSDWFGVPQYRQYLRELAIISLSDSQKTRTLSISGLRMISLFTVSSNGKMIADVRKSSIHVYDPQTGKGIASLPGKFRSGEYSPDKFIHAEFSPDDSILVTGDSTGGYAAYSTNDWQEVWRKTYSPDDSGKISLQFSPDNSIFVIGDPKGRHVAYSMSDWKEMWRASYNKMRQTSWNNLYGAVYVQLPNNSFGVWEFSGKNAHLDVRSYENGEQLRSQKTFTLPNAISVNYDVGAQLMMDGRIEVVRPLDNRIVAILGKPDGIVREKLVVSDDGRFVACIGDVIEVWDVNSGELKSGKDYLSKRPEGYDWRKQRPDYLTKKAAPVSLSDYQRLVPGMTPHEVWKILGGQPTKEGSDVSLDVVDETDWKFDIIEMYPGNGGDESKVILLYHGDTSTPPLVKKLQVGLR
jgi:hypothetical protein